MAGSSSRTSTSLESEGFTTRRIAERFLKWAIKTKAAPAGLTIVPHRRGTSPRLAKPEQDEALKRCRGLQPRLLDPARRPLGQSLGHQTLALPTLRRRGNIITRARRNQLLLPEKAPEKTS